MKIGNIEFKHGVFLAPLAGIGDFAFRSLCASYGAEGVCTELISAKAVVYSDKKTYALASLRDCERPAAIQIFGSDPAVMAEAAAKLMRFNPQYIDINMGCPVPKLVKNGEGSALLRDRALCGRIVSAVVSAVNVPVTVKIRSGFDKNSINAAEIARECEQSGAYAVFVHARTREQMYAGDADWSVIKSVKDAVKIPVIGNGDVKCGADAKRMLELTGCDGVMIGRGAFGSPWMFEEVISFLENRSPRVITPDEKRDCVRSQIRRFLESKSEKGLPEMRKHMVKYARGFEGSSLIRASINDASTEDDFENIINKLFV